MFSLFSGVEIRVVPDGYPAMNGTEIIVVKRGRAALLGHKMLVVQSDYDLIVARSRHNLATPSPTFRHDPGLEAGETGE